MAEDDLDDTEEFDRYMGYIVLAFNKRDDWKVHARQLLIELGEDPDELERQSEKETSEILSDPQKVIDAARPFLFPETSQPPKETAVPIDHSQLTIAFNAETISQEIAEWFRAGAADVATALADPLKQSAADQLRQMVLQSTLKPLSIGALSTCIAPLAEIFEKEPIPAELHISICTRRGSSDGVHAGYTLPDFKSLLEPWTKQEFYEVSEPVEWAPVAINETAGPFAAVAAAIEYWMRDFWRENRTKSDINKFIQDMMFAIAALAEKKGAVDNAAAIRSMAGLTVAERRVSGWSRMLYSMSNDLYEEATNEEIWGPEPTVEKDE